jgi:hypothetical protein
MTPVSSANNIDSVPEFIFRGKSFIHTTNIRGPRIDPWGIPSFSVPFLEK